MNEVMEILYQWHQGAGIKGITRSLGYRVSLSLSSFTVRLVRGGIYQVCPSQLLPPPIHWNCWVLCGY